MGLLFPSFISLNLKIETAEWPSVRGFCFFVWSLSRQVIKGLKCKNYTNEDNLTIAVITPTFLIYHLKPRYVELYL